MLDYLTEEK